MSKADVEEWLRIRKEAGLKIDPRTAEVEWTYADICEPYGVLPEDLCAGCIGRAYFARSPGSDIWVSFDDLPNETRETLLQKHEKRRLAFPAGFEDLIREHARQRQRACLNTGLRLVR